MKAAVALIAVAAGLGGAARLNTQGSEEAAVRRALDHYLQAHATGDGAHARLPSGRPRTSTGRGATR